MRRISGTPHVRCGAFEVWIEKYGEEDGAWRTCIVCEQKRGWGKWQFVSEPHVSVASCDYHIIIFYYFLFCKLQIQCFLGSGGYVSECKSNAWSTLSSPEVG